MQTPYVRCFDTFTETGEARSHHRYTHSSAAMHVTPRLAQLLLLSTILLKVLQLPAQAQVTAAGGDANTVITQSGNTFDITGGTTAGNNLFQSFQKFGLNTDQIANFRANPTIQNILGRVVGGDASIINGLIKVTGSNANLYLMNPAGIVFGANARLDVAGSFTATTANGIGFGNQWFNAVGANNYAALVGNPSSFAFTMPQPGAIVNAGNLAVGTGQSLTLLGGTVINTGTLTAPEGQITIAAVPGEKLVRLTQTGSLLSLDLPAATKAAINPQPFNPLTLPELLTGGNLSSATGVTLENGIVKLTGSGVVIPTDVGVAIVAGQVSTQGTTGGIVHVFGQKVGLVGATIDASGTNGGGTVLIGGDYKGQGVVPNAQQTYVSSDSVISADAGQTGNGGKVIVWADNTTRFYGSISARGGSKVGNGGFVEVSGKQNLTFDGSVTVQALAGTAGQLLLDPTSVVIGAAGTNNNELDDRQIFASDPGGTFFISADRVVQALSTGDITIAAGTDITVNAAIDATANTNTAFLKLAAPQINLNNSIQLKNGDITLNGNVISNAPPNSNPFLVGVNSLRTVIGNITINGNLNSFNDTGLDLTASETIRVAGGIGNTSSLRYVQLSNAKTATLNNYTGKNRLYVNVRQLRLESPGDVTISNNIFTSSVDRIQVVAGNNLTVVENYLSPRENLSLSAANTLTLNNATLDGASFPGADLQIQGQAVKVFGFRSSGYRDVTIQGQTIDIQSTTTKPVGLLTQGNLTLKAQKNLQIQDGVNPVLIQAEGDLTAQGKANVSLQMLNQPQSVLRSGGNLAVISDTTIVANARILSEGNLAFLQTSGAPGDVNLSPVSSSGIISSSGNVTFNNYTGPSLKVEARGSIQGGTITINGANTTLQGSDPDIAILSSIPSVILRAGLSELQNSSNVYPDNQHLRNTPTVPPDRSVGTATFTTSNSPSAGTITVGDILIQSSSSSSVDVFKGGKQIILSATDGIKTGNISSGNQSAALSTMRGNIKAGDISTAGFSGYNGVFLSAPKGNIEISTIDTGAAGIDIAAGGTFRALGSKTSTFDGSGTAFFNNPDLIDYLVSQGFDRQQLLNANVRLERNFDPRPPLRSSLISRPSDVIVGKPKSPITIRYGDQSQVILDRDNGVSSPSGRILILGDSQQKFRIGPIPKDGLTFVPADPKDRIQDYNPTTNNFSFEFNESVPLTYPSEQFPVGASGLAAGITIGPGNNSSLYGSAQFKVFDPIIRSGTDSTPVTLSGGDNSTINNANPTPDTINRTANIGKETRQIIQKDLNAQTQGSACNPSSTIAAAPSTTTSGSETRSPRATTASTTTASNPCASASSDDAQILKILGE